jgi:hypothetical protein
MTLLRQYQPNSIKIKVTRSMPGIKVTTKHIIIKEYNAL